MSEERNRRGRPKGTGIDDRGQLQRIAALLASDPELKPTTAIKSLGVSDPSIIRRLRDKFHEARLELMADVSGNAKPVAQVTATKQATPKLAPAARIQQRPAGEPAAQRAIPARIGEPVRKTPVAPRVASLPKSAAPAPATVVPQNTPPTATPVGEMPVAAKAFATTPAATGATAPSPAGVSAKPEAPTASPSLPVTATQTNVDPAAWLFAMCGFGIFAASTALEAQVALAKSLVRLPPMALALRQHIALNELAMTMVTPSATTRAGFH